MTDKKTPLSGASANPAGVPFESVRINGGVHECVPFRSIITDFRQWLLQNRELIEAPQASAKAIAHNEAIEHELMNEKRCDCCQLWEDRATGLTAHGEYFLCDICLGDLGDG